MSDTLRELDLAVQRHIAESYPGELVDSWVLVSHSNGLEDETHDLHNYRMVEANDAQPWHTTAGLVQVASRIVKDAWDWAGEEDD